jgi:hypothetical protein
VSCFSSCFRATKKEDPANLVAIDHKHYFPKEFTKTVTSSVGKRLSKSDLKGKKKRTTGGLPPDKPIAL